MTPSDLERLTRLADWMDARFRVPGTNWRFGLDGLFGLVPGIGDTATGLVSLYFIAEAWRLGASPRTILRMLGNVGIDYVMGAIPVAGDAFDFIWKANRRNLRLLERELRTSAPSARRALNVDRSRQPD